MTILIGVSAGVATGGGEHAAGYAPWLGVALAVWIPMAVVGSIGAVLAPVGVWRRAAYAAWVLGVLGLAGTWGVVTTDAWCQSGYVAADGACAWE